jgi:hypothetical protein
MAVKKKMAVSNQRCILASRPGGCLLHIKVYFGQISEVKQVTMHLLGTAHKLARDCRYTHRHLLRINSTALPWLRQPVHSRTHIHIQSCH